MRTFEDKPATREQVPLLIGLVGADVNLCALPEAQPLERLLAPLCVRCGIAT